MPTEDARNGAIVSTDPAYAVVISGEIDLLNAGAVREILLRAVDACEQSTFVVHGGGVTFMDSVGLSALIAAVNQAKNKGLAMVIVEPSVRLKRLIEITGLTDVLPMAE